MKETNRKCDLNKKELFYQCRLEYLQKEVSNKNNDRSIIIAILLALITIILNNEKIIAPDNFIEIFLYDSLEYSLHKILITIVLYYFFITLIIQLLYSIYRIKECEAMIYEYNILNKKKELFFKCFKYIVYSGMLFLMIWLNYVNYSDRYLQKIDLNKLIENRKDNLYCDFKDSVIIYPTTGKSWKRIKNGISYTKIIQINSLIYKCSKIVIKVDSKTKNYKYKTFLIDNGKEIDLNINYDFNRTI